MGRKRHRSSRRQQRLDTWRFDTADGRWSKLASHSPGWSDAAGWDDAANYPTIQTAVVGDQLFLLARANAGIHTWRVGNERDRPLNPL